MSCGDGQSQTCLAAGDGGIPDGRNKDAALAQRLGRVQGQRLIADDQGNDCAVDGRQGPAGLEQGTFDLVNGGPESAASRLAFGGLDQFNAGTSGGGGGRY